MVGGSHVVVVVGGGYRYWSHGDSPPLRLWTHRQTDVTKNITFPQTTCSGGNYMIIHSFGSNSHASYGVKTNHNHAEIFPTNLEGKQY